MIRSQIYLTNTERKQLRTLMQDTGKSQSELIRAAIDQFLTQQQQFKLNKLEILRMARGLWKDRKDLSNFSLLRQEWDRY